MNIIFKTKYPNAPCSMFYKDAISSIDNISISDNENYDKYDIALFMTYPLDIDELIRVKKAYPHIKTGLIDPRGSHIKRCLYQTDFLIVDGLEMKDFFSKYQLPIFQYY